MQSPPSPEEVYVQPHDPIPSVPKVAHASCTSDLLQMWVDELRTLISRIERTIAVLQKDKPVAPGK